MEQNAEIDRAAINTTPCCHLARKTTVPGMADTCQSTLLLLHSTIMVAQNAKDRGTTTRYCQSLCTFSGRSWPTRMQMIYSGPERNSELLQFVTKCPLIPDLLNLETHESPLMPRSDFFLLC